MEEKHNSPATAGEQPPPSSSEAPPSRRRGGLKRKASNLHNNNASTPPPPSSKRQTREKPSPVLFSPIHNGPLTRARLQPNYGDTSTFWEAVAVNEGEGAVAAAATMAAKVEEELSARREAWEALEAKVEAEYGVVKSRGDSVHVVPVSAGWFSWTEIHPLEEKALPSFFNGKLENRTREIYLEIRNSVVKKFHENPKTQIEEKDLSEIPVGELDAKKEVMDFLDYWGLINYHPLPETDVVNSVGDTEEAAKVNSLIQKLYEFDVEQSCSPAVPRSSFATPAVPYRLPESIPVDDSAQPEGPSVEYHCNSCAADCSRKRYHCQKQADFDLCTECFNEGKFDSDMAPSDFILMEPGDAAGASSGTWTDQETLLLLEALQLFSENWNEIAEHVATKTKAQCILHFLQMPIEDTFRDCDDDDEKKDTKSVDDNGEKKDAKSSDENDEKKDAKSSDENNEKKEVGQSQQENDDKMEVDKENGDSQDTKETKDLKADNDQPGSGPMEISESVDDDKMKDDIQENGVNIAVKALREAFDAVGSVSSLDEKLCFADAGNPVMAMAAFLTRLVKPNIATATARTSMKSVSGLQLSERHSFLLEDPADETTKADDTDRDVQKVVEQEVSKEKTDSCDKQEDEREGTKVTENENKTEKQSVSNEKKDVVTAEVTVSKKGSKAGTRRKGGASKKDKDPATEKPPVIEETNKQTDKVENNSSDSKKETEDPADGGTELGLVVSESTEAPKDEEMAEKTESPPSTLANNTPSSGDTGAKDSKDVNEKPPDTKDDPVTHKLTRAAVAAISAAAVKAKFLADQEEDQIRQLATSLVEKQLHKLETKLTFFTEMDGVVSRAREQLERSKRGLYHERAQIIAARLGMSGAASSRPMAHPGQRPPNPMGMTPQRPPLSRPMMGPGPTPPFSNAMGPTSVAGNPAQISNNQAMK
ncbi:putative transcription factor MYB/SANT family [Helianthus annuus]|uniref:Transcription factor MYB/SANT family n=1 Tax=Helianthus annuus TaxID=4232 RepID=A0A9K3DQF5_HELAN|nr:SWI/SNF complex subunit SWI3D isoform X1 [Helianthus annuus]KAF5758763.1 putative transcription factor MYB/SANT family [Helianthus annuus]KAJ0820045.1 putative transcription factor MYB/SANT family [Helianthus annuus]